MPDSDQTPDLGIDALVVAARTSRGALGRLYELYYERILGYCWRRLNKRTAAEDVCGETFLYVARKMSTFRGSTEGDFRRWVYRIATNEVNAYLRRSIRRKDLWDTAVQENRLKGENAQSPIEQDDSADWPVLHQAIRRLNTREQTIVAFRLQEEMSYDEIGQILGMRPGTVRVTYSRAIQKLRDLLSSNATQQSYSSNLKGES